MKYSKYIYKDIVKKILNKNSPKVLKYKSENHPIAKLRTTTETTMLPKEERNIIELVKKIMTEEKEVLPSLRNKDWENKSRQKQKKSINYLKIFPQNLTIWFILEKR